MGKRKQKKQIETTVSGQLYVAVQQTLASGWSVNGIAHAAGVPQSTLQEWVTGHREQISQRTANALCAWLRMRLTDPQIPDRPTANR